MPIHFFVPGRRPRFPDTLHATRDGLVALGGALDAEVLRAAYSRGIFPWTGAHPIPWYCPDPRMVLEPAALHVSRSLRKVLARSGFEVRVDTCFLEVMRRCATQPRPGQAGTWITPNMLRAYGALHREGNAHSVEVFDTEGALCGGLYGVSLGRAFFGESMFATASNASKVALVHLCRHAAERGFELIDCQQETPHLRRMGARPISRAEFLRRLAPAVAAPNAW